MNTINFGELMQNAGSGFDPVPDGPYDVRVAKAEASKTSNDKDMWKVQFKILSGPHQNKVVFNNFVLSPESPNALTFFFSDMAALGLDSKFFAQQLTPDQVASALEDRTAQIIVGHREWNGQIRNEVKRVKPLNGVAPTGATATAPPPPAPEPPPPVPAPTKPTPPPAPEAPPAPEPTPEPVIAGVGGSEPPPVPF